MNIDNSFMQSAYKDITASVKQRIEDNKSVTGKDITNQYLAEYQLQMVSETKVETTKQADLFTLADIGYNGKPIADLSQNEAKALVSDNGFFGIAKTSQRIADFVLSGAGDDAQKLQAGKEGILQGFKDAEGLWGGKLPDISYETINKAVEQIDAKLAKLGASVLDTNA